MRSVERRVWSVEGRKRCDALRARSATRPSTLDLQPRRGMTLIELLVVIIIITTLVAAVIPLLSPANDDRRLREATRGLNTYITGAQSRAASTHRPYGIAIKRLSAQTGKNSPGDPLNDNGVSLEVQYVEEPPPYAGFDEGNSRASVALYPNQDLHPGYAIVRFLTRGTLANMPTGWQGDLFPSGMIRPGDVIEVNGTEFELLNDTSANSNITVVDIDQNQNPNNPVYYFAPPPNGVPQILARPLNDSGQQIYPKYDSTGQPVEAGNKPTLKSPFWTEASPYKILRQPTLTSDEPYQLPEGTALDLRASGVGSNDYFHVQSVRDNDQNILVLFTPEGRVARVTYSMAPRDTVENDDITDNPSDLFDQTVVDNVYLLVGRRDRIEAANVGTDPTLNGAKIAAAQTPEDQDKLREPINWLNGSSRWVVIGSQSGRVVTVENAHVDIASIFNTFTTQSPPLAASSEDLRNEQIKSAREFTHEMKQLGGR